jgi:hypothetical protein
VPSAIGGQSTLAGSSLWRQRLQLVRPPSFQTQALQCLCRLAGERRTRVDCQSLLVMTGLQVQVHEHCNGLKFALPRKEHTLPSELDYKAILLLRGYLLRATVQELELMPKILCIFAQLRIIQNQGTRSTENAQGPFLSYFGQCVKAVHCTSRAANICFQCPECEGGSWDCTRGRTKN